MASRELANDLDKSPGVTQNYYIMESVQESQLTGVGVWGKNLRLS